MKPSMIFHYPMPINARGNSGSQIRPRKMIEAFENIGYEVNLVTGYARDRKKKIKKLLNDFKKGKMYDFIYSESSTLPTLLTEPHHLPIYPGIDFGFFDWAKKIIPVGLFYRDIAWRFEFFKNSLSWYKQKTSIAFYKYDWKQYKKFVDVLFLPSSYMAAYLPDDYFEKNDKISILPPGCSINNSVNYSSQNKIMTLLYVGGVTPPRYDLQPLSDTMRLISNVNLYLVCRSKEWDLHKKNYNFDANVNIIHLNVQQLASFYIKSDLFVLLSKPDSYLKFAMPVKIFEALGYGLPILTFSGTEAARFIKKEDIGWVVNNVEEAKQLLLHLQKNRHEIKSRKEVVKKVRGNHTWEARALQVVETLIKNKRS